MNLAGSSAYSGAWEFTVADITPPIVVVTTPDIAGTILIGGQNFDIQWTAVDSGSGIDSASIYLSYDGGETYPYTIATGIPEIKGNYVWTVMDTFATNCRVKVEVWDKAGNSGADESDNNFRV